MSVWPRIRSRIEPPHPVGPETVIRRFSPDRDIPIAQTPDVPVAHSGVSAINGGWRLTANARRVFRLFEVADSSLDRRVLIYRAKLRARGVKQRAYLEMWCHIPGDGTYFSKGTHRAVKGTRGWARHEIRFHLKAGQRPDTISLNLTFDGAGVIDIRKVELASKAVPGLLNPRRALLVAMWLAWRMTRLVAFLLMNVPLIVLSIVLGGALFWWPEAHEPTVGKLAG
jgi:hypothetical protein